MELQIVDVDGCQVQPSGLQNTRSWVEEVRGNTRQLEETGAYDFLEANACRGVACYVVALWCRSSCGQSICILVCDATRHVYKRLREDSARNKAVLEDIYRTLRNDAGDLVSCEVLHLHTTNGWRCEEQDPHVAKAFPWLRVSVVNASQHRNVSCDSSGSCGQWLQQHREHFEEHFQENEDPKKKKHVVSAQEKLDLRTEVLQATGLKPGGWLKLTPELERRLFSTPRAPKVWCSASLQVRTEELRGLALPEKMAMAPLRVLSFDIECVSQEDGFPLASNQEDAVICIGLYCKALGEDDSSAVCKMLCLGETAALPESTARTEVLCFELESELLAAFGTELSRMDADVVAGYNTCLFDWSYLGTRIEAVHRLTDRTKYSRRKELKTPPKQQTLSSGAMGDNPLCYPRMPGRVNFDLWLYLKRENIGGLENLKLDTISKHFLNDAKVDLPAKEMFRCYREGAAGRAQVAHYCRQDCKLVLDLLEKVEALPSVWEMAKITCTSPEDILFRGQQIKVYTQLVLTANEVGYLVEDKPLAEEEEKHEEGGFQGATVVTPTPGYYLEPVFCLDFASLYPSLMRTYNLSPECLLPPELRTRQEILTNDIQVDGARSHRFIRSSVHEGLLPRILEQLLSERKRVKKLMDKEDDPKVRSLLNRKQLALKISANSVYGACGSTKGKLSCVECAEATTSAGRSAIDFTCSYVNRLPGFQIIYGDTDSAFCRLPSTLKDASMQELFDRGEELASEITEEITKLFPGEKCHIKLEFEKVFHPLILYKKKRYAGLCCENPEKPSKIMARGLELVRRDACQLVKDTQKTVIDLLLQKKDLEGSVHAMLDALRSILEIPIGGPFRAIKQSKSLKQAYHDEESQVQCVVRSLMRQRESGSEPRVGDRVEYVVVASTSQRVVDKCEDVCFAERQGLPPDWLHYLEAAERPLKAILEVPLASLRPTLLQHLEGVCRGLKQKAGGLVAKHCMARKGVIWRSGHLSKDGSVQSKLDSCFAPPRPRGEAVVVPEPRAAEDAAHAAEAAANEPRRGGAYSSSRAASSTATLTRPHATSFSYEEAPSAAVLKGSKRQKTKELLAAKTAALDTYFGNKKC